MDVNNILAAVRLTIGLISTTRNGINLNRFAPT